MGDDANQFGQASRFSQEASMNTGEAPFAQPMDVLP